MHKLNSSDKDFAAAFARLLTLRESEGQSVESQVRAIINRVRSEGDKAIFALTEQFDRLRLNPQNIRVSAREIDTARKACGKDVIKALEHAAKRIRKYHKKQMPDNLQYKDKHGMTLGWRWSAIDAVGIYVPGGTASYPSSVLMNAIPAQVAGVARIAMVVPTPDDKMNPAILAAANIAGVNEIYRIGGAQAVAALAYGTASIDPVDKIVGPGNEYVAEAKRQVFGKVGIDMIAGPSEILVVADNKNNSAWIAADLLSQAEHDAHAQSILITNDKAFALAVEKAVTATLKQLPRTAIASASWNNYGAIIVVKDFKDALPLIDAIAPEHLELAISKPEAFAAKVRHAGAIFMGRLTPEAIGDYIAGPSHVLPTNRTARFSSGLSVFDFIKRTSLMGCNAEASKALSGDAAALADSEGLGAHALSIRLRR